MILKTLKKISNNQESQSLSYRLRQKRFARFIETLKISDSTTILDAGGSSSTWMGTGLEERVTLLNITSPKQQDLERGYKAVKGSATEMDMFDDQSFDIIFSNSVIEHVGSFENQRKFAGEVKRVGRGYWIQTPNRYFPIEPHVLFPFFQFLPNNLQNRIALKWKFSHLKQWNLSDERILNEIKSTRLLSAAELTALFQEAKMYKEKIFGITKSLVVYKKCN